jgi:hypothetical protein
LIALFAAMGLRAARDRDNDDAGTDYSNRFGLFAHDPRFRQRAIGAIALGTAENHFMSGRVAHSKKPSSMAEYTALAS